MKVAELAQMIVPDVYESELQPPIAVWWMDHVVWKWRQFIGNEEGCFERSRVVISE